MEEQNEEVKKEMTAQSEQQAMQANKKEEETETNNNKKETAPTTEEAKQTEVQIEDVTKVQEYDDGAAPQYSKIFQDEVKVNGQTVLTVSMDNFFYGEEKKERKSRWGDKAVKKKIHKDVVFNPLAIEGPKLLALKNEPVKSGRITKFGPEYDKTFHPPPLNYIPRKITLLDLEYIIRLYRLDEIQRKLQLQDFVQQDVELRSPSPEPAYDQKGLRTNTRENRGKEALLMERNDIIEECMALKKEFIPPSDYKPMKKAKKIYLPDTQADSTNYIGLVIGPRGTTQKALEKKCKCKISIRGKGANNKFAKNTLEEYDKLHILLQADTDERIEQGAELIQRILAGEQTDDLKEVKKDQCLALQAITGILLDFCENCHEKGHRVWACPLNLKTKTTVVCGICGDKSHPTTDCPRKKDYLAGIPIEKHSSDHISQKSKDFYRFLREIEGSNVDNILSVASKIKEDNNNNDQPKKPGNNVNFVTDDQRMILALTNEAANPQQLAKLDQKPGQLAQGLSHLLTNDEKRKEMEREWLDHQRYNQQQALAVYSQPSLNYTPYSYPTQNQSNPLLQPSPQPLLQAQQQMGMQNPYSNINYPQMQPNYNQNYVPYKGIIQQTPYTNMINRQMQNNPYLMQQQLQQDFQQSQQVQQYPVYKY